MERLIKREDYTSLHIFYDSKRDNLWKAAKNSTYYDKKIDTQGSVPGSTYEVAKEKFIREFSK